MEAQGQTVHDEADFVHTLCGAGSVASVLDAGCGTGRVAAELARRGLHVVGVDNDPDMLALAAKKPEPVQWELGDLASVDLGRRFDVVVMAGNILAFVEPDSRAEVIANLARHIDENGAGAGAEGGLLVMGSEETEGCSFSEVDRWCADAGLEILQLFGTWDRRPFLGSYRVSVHRRL